MTGYGRGVADAPGLKVSIELRSVNNRFADLKLRLPDLLAPLEAELRRRILATVKRGRVDVDLRIERDRTAGAPLTLNRPAVDAALAAWKALRDEYGIAGAWDLASLMRVPGLLDASDAGRELDDATRDAVLAALDRAVADLDASRRREGELLRSDLAARIDRMREVLTGVAERARGVPEAQRKKLLERLEQLAAGVALDPARVAQEVAFLADRADVTEEIVRLEGHLAQAKAHLDAEDGEPVGKRFDFLLQEIHRETNTIASKSVDLAMSRGAIDLKAEAEKIREQIQNVE